MDTDSHAGPHRDSLGRAQWPRFAQFGEGAALAPRGPTRRTGIDPYPGGLSMTGSALDRAEILRRVGDRGAIRVIVAAWRDGWAYLPGGIRDSGAARSGGRGGCDSGGAVGRRTGQPGTAGFRRKRHHLHRDQSGKATARPQSAQDAQCRQCQGRGASAAERAHRAGRRATLPARRGAVHGRICLRPHRNGGGTATATAGDPRADHRNRQGESAPRPRRRPDRAELMRPRWSYCPPRYADERW